MTSRHSFTLAAVLLAGLTGATPRPASAQTFTITFENATGISNQPTPNNYQNAAATFKDAFGGSNTISGVTFDNNFTIFRNTYTNGVGGNDLYGAAHGNFALTNTNPAPVSLPPNTGPNDPGLDGLIFTTNAVLQSAYFAANDYGNTSFGADQVTVNALAGNTVLASVSLSLFSGLDSQGNQIPITSLTLMDTHTAFNPFAGQITGYSINRNTAALYKSFGSGGGNYVADDFTFAAPAPEPSALPAFTLGVLTLTVWVFVGRRSIRAMAQTRRDEDR